MTMRNPKKVFAILLVALGISGVGLAFQNFMPHDPFAGHDTRDLYMDGALTEALKKADKSRRESLKKPEAATQSTGTDSEVKAAQASGDIDSSSRAPASHKD